MVLTLRKFHLISILAALLCVGQLIDARQIRINRYSTLIDEEDNGVNVPLTRLQPAPTLGEVAIREGRAFQRLNNTNVETTTVADFDSTTTTTEYPLDLSTTTSNYDLDITTLSTSAEEEINDDTEARKAPYPAAGYRPSRAFLLPTEIETTERSVQLALTTTESSNDAVSTTTTGATDGAVEAGDANSSARAAPPPQKAPYPPAGYRPSRAFLLPTESLMQNAVEEPPAVANHPVCGSNANPLAPKPLPDAEKNPDAENVYVTAAVGPAVVSAQVPEIIIRSEPLVTQPLIIASRPFAYSAQWQTW